MGLISRTVKITWQRCTCTHYKNLGYNYTKVGDEFEVNVEHLPKGSAVKVIVQCDGCEKIITNTQWCDYSNSVKEDNKYYCDKCIKKYYSVEKRIKSMISNGNSFEQWCIKNNRQDILDRWDYEKNRCNPKDITKSTKIKYWFKCPKGIHESELKEIGNFTSGHDGCMNCKACNSFAQWGIDNIGTDFLERYWSNKNTVSPWKVANGCQTKVWLKCQEKEYHEDYLIRCVSFTKDESRCSYCSNNSGKVHPLDSLGSIYPQVIEIWSNKNKKTPYECRINSPTWIHWKCENKIHNDYLRRIRDSNFCNFRCPECVRERTESFLQEKVRLYLEYLGYEVLHEHACTIRPINPKTHQPLPYDNEIVEIKLIVEVHGSQHYNFGGNWIKTEYDLHKRKLYDRYKRMYAKSKGYHYLEIPYWVDDTNETWKLMINEKIKNISI